MVQNEKSKRGRKAIANKPKRRSLQLRADVYDEFANLVSGVRPIQDAASDVIAFCMEHEDKFGLVLAILMRRWLPSGEAAVDKAFCEILTVYRDRVCTRVMKAKAKPPRGLLLDESETTQANSH